MHYSRKERRALAKSLGLIGQNETTEQWRERIRRSQEAGRQIDRQFQNNNESNMRNAAAEAETRQLESWTAKFGEEQAKLMIASNRKVAEECATKLAARLNKKSKLK